MTAASGLPMLLAPHSLVGSTPSTKSPTKRKSERRVDSSSVREVVVCLDGSDLGRRVVPHAQLIADALSARLTLLHVLETDAAAASPADPLDWRIRQREARAHLDDVKTDLTESDVGIRSELVEGRAAEQICRWAKQHQIDITVLCSHGQRGLTGWDLGSTARKLIDRVPGSLLLVPAVAAARDEAARYRRILVPLDGSPQAESVAPLVMRIASAQRAEVLFVHVVRDPEIARMGPLDTEGAELERRVLEHNRAVASDYLDRLRSRVGQPGTQLRTLVVSGGTAQAQLERLIRAEKVDLVAMSAHGLTSRCDCPCGGVTEYLVTHAVTPVLVVRDAARMRTRARQIDPSNRVPSERSVADHPLP